MIRKGFARDSAVGPTEVFRGGSDSARFARTTTKYRSTKTMYLDYNVIPISKESTNSIRFSAHLLRKHREHFLRLIAILMVILMFVVGLTSTSTLASYEKNETILDFFEIALEEKQKPDMKSALENFGTISLGPILDAMREYEPDSVIKRWSSPIVISITESLSLLASDSVSRKNAVLDIVKSSKSAISSVSGVPLYVVTNDGGKSPNVVIHLGSFSRFSVYKGNRSIRDKTRILGYWHFLGEIPKYLSNATPFTVELDNQADGYIITDESHNILSAYCSIWSGHEVAMVQKLSRECILRIMGLPGASVSRRDHYLGHWNHGQSVQRLGSDNCKVYFIDLETNEVGCREKAVLDGRSVTSKVSRVDDYFPCYDMVMLSLLYDGELVAGMAQREALPIAYSRFDQVVSRIDDFGQTGLCRH